MENNDFIIGNGALKKYIGSSTEVIIPDGVIEIGEYAFYNCEKLTIYAPADSTAGQFAKRNNIPFVEIKKILTSFHRSQKGAPKVVI